MNNPLVSIVVPIYDVEKYIRECLESLFHQTYSNIEYVFVNDKTPDKSMDILSQVVKECAPQNVRIINHENNLGLCGARSSGLKAATGEYVMIVDSDDKLPYDAVETLVNCAIENNADYVESDFAYYSKNGVGETCKRYYSDEKIVYLASIIGLKVVVAIWGKLYRRTLFGDIDDLFVVGRDNVEDSFANPILLDRAHRTAYSGKVTYYYRIDNPNAFSVHGYVKWKRVDDFVYSVKRHTEYFSKYDNVIIGNAISEKKYRIKRLYYPLLENAADRNRLIELFPENEEYVKSKPLIERVCWMLMRHDMRNAYNIFYKLANKFKL